MGAHGALGGARALAEVAKYVPGGAPSRAGRMRSARAVNSPELRDGG